MTSVLCVLCVTSAAYRTRVLTLECYTEKATPARQRPERQYNACANRRKQCSPNETKSYSNPTTPRQRQNNPTNGHTPRTQECALTPSHQAGDQPTVYLHTQNVTTRGRCGHKSEREKLHCGQKTQHAPTQTPCSLQSPVIQSKHVPGRLIPRLHPQWHRHSRTVPLKSVGTNKTYICCLYPLQVPLTIPLTRNYPLM